MKRWTMGSSLSSMCTGLQRGCTMEHRMEWRAWLGTAATSLSERAANDKRLEPRGSFSELSKTSHSPAIMAWFCEAEGRQGSNSYRNTTPALDAANITSCVWPSRLVTSKNSMVGTKACSRKEKTRTLPSSSLSVDVSSSLT